MWTPDKLKNKPREELEMLLCRFQTNWFAVMYNFEQYRTSVISQSSTIDSLAAKRIVQDEDKAAELYEKHHV